MAGLPVVLITANVGSIFEEVSDFQKTHFNFNYPLITFFSLFY